MIIPEPPGLELSGLPDFLPPRSVETEARVQRGVTDNAGSRLRPVSCDTASTIGATH